jgi:integrase
MERTGRTQLSLYGRDGRRKYLTSAERTLFVGAALAHQRCAVTTLALVVAYTGCRISEALQLRSSAIEQREAFIAIFSLKKRGKIVIREVPIPVFLVKLLVETHNLEAAPPDAKLWTWSRSRAWWLIKDVMRDAGIDGGVHATCKGLRHGFAIHALRCGVPINLVSRWLGHASLATTAIYLDALGDEERAFAERMWQGDRPLNLLPSLLVQADAIRPPLR